MIYDNLILNKYTFKNLTSFYKKKHLPNAFIFYGNEGIGKEAHAIEFFALMNCKEPDINSACGKCNSCNKIKILQHELLNIIVPLPKSKKIGKNDNSLSALTEKQQLELINQFSEKGKNPYHKIKLDKANTIIINSIKDIKNSSTLSVPNGNIKLHLILDAHKLCYPKQESANALLKILEEPKENNLFILVTSQISKIIDTISSRCVPVFFNDINYLEIEEKISEKVNDPNKTKIISKICEGSLRKAYDLIDSFDNKISILGQLIKSIKNNDINRWNSEFKRKDKNYICKYFNLLTFFFRDLEFIKKSNKSDICFSEFLDFYIEYNNNNTNTKWADCIKSINNAQNYLLRNGSPQLVSAALFIEIQNIINCKNKSMFELNEWIA